MRSDIRSQEFLDDLEEWVTNTIDGRFWLQDRLDEVMEDMREDLWSEGYDEGYESGFDSGFESARETFE